MKINKKVVFEVVRGFGRHSGVTLVLWGCPWDAVWLRNRCKILRMLRASFRGYVYVLLLANFLGRLPRKARGLQNAKEKATICKYIYIYIWIYIYIYIYIQRERYGEYLLLYVRMVIYTVFQNDQDDK